MTTEPATAEASLELASQLARIISFTGRDFSAGFIRQMSREPRTWSKPGIAGGESP